MGVLTQTHSLRWLKLNDDGAMRLQQAWMDRQTGELTWIDVPLVVEKTGQAEKTVGPKKGLTHVLAPIKT